MMVDNIIFNKLWQDNELIELEVLCSSSIITTKSRIYVADDLIDELIYQIQQFLDGKIEEGIWANETKGDMSTACLSLRFFKKDKLGHINIEVYVELDDGGKFSEHNCCFFITTEYGLLMNFCKNLVYLKRNFTNAKVQLNSIS